MEKNQKSYTPEFKQQIVDLYNAGGTSYPQPEREYGVNRSTISGWVKQLSPIKVSEEETLTLKEHEALHSVLKKEETYLHTYQNSKEARRAIFEYIEGWYNRKRIHSFIGYLTPQQEVCAESAQRPAASNPPLS
ncbi:transposase [Clostridiales bacterium]|nr:transposase [Clostridiales bacterium]